MNITFLCYEDVFGSLKNDDAGDKELVSDLTVSCCFPVGLADDDEDKFDDDSRTEWSAELDEDAVVIAAVIGIRYLLLL